MNKSILISGRQAAGKTTLLEKYLSDSKMLNVIKTTFSNTKTPTFKHVTDGFDVVGVDEVANINQLQAIVKKMESARVQFIVCWQFPISEIPKDILTKFEVVQLNRHEAVL